MTMPDEIWAMEATHTQTEMGESRSWIEGYPFTEQELKDFNAVPYVLKSKYDALVTALKKIECTDADWECRTIAREALSKAGVE